MYIGYWRWYSNLVYLARWSCINLSPRATLVTRVLFHGCLSTNGLRAFSCWYLIRRTCLHLAWHLIRINIWGVCFCSRCFFACRLYLYFGLLIAIVSAMGDKVKCREGHHRCHFHRYAHPASAADSLQWWSVGGLNFLTEGSSCHCLDGSWSQGSNRLRCKVRLSPWPDSGLTSCTGLPSPFLAITTWISSSQKARSFPGPPQGVRLRIRTRSPTCNAEDFTRLS